MSKFLNRNTTPVEKVDIEVTVKVSVPKGKEEQVKADLQAIVNKASASEINILRRVCDNPLVKSQAIAKAKEYV